MRGLRWLPLWWCAACSFQHGEASTTSPSDAADGPVDVRPDGPGRITADLIALYSFDEGSGATIHDTATSGSRVDMTIADTSKIAWGTGQLTVMAPVDIQSQSGVVCPVNVECKTTGAITVEAWVVATAASQSGVSGQSARVITTSVNTGGRNFSIGQLGASWTAEVRTGNAGVDLQGDPVLLGPPVVTVPTQLVLVADSTTRAFYVDGQLAGNDSLGGSFANWLSGYYLVFGAEPQLSNAWKGAFLLVAIYDRALSNAEIMQNFELGPNAR